MRALGSFIVLVLVVSCLALAEAENEHKQPAANAKAGGLNLASKGSSIAQQHSSDSHASIHASTLRRVVRHLRKLNEDDENDSQEEEADQDEQSKDDEDDEDQDNEEQQGSYSVQGEYKNDYQGYQSQYKTSGRSSSSSSTSSDASADNMSWDNSIGGGIAVWSLSAVAISLYALVGIRSFYRRYGDRDIYTGAGVPGGSGNSLAGMDDNVNDKKVNLILPSGKELECENTVVSAMTGYPAPL